VAEPHLTAVPSMARPGVLSWASRVEESALDQAERTARLPVVAGHVALMPDAHTGFGPPIGAVIPTEGAVIPYAVGVDIGCGMIATETDLAANDLPDSLRSLMPLIEQRIPAGVGQGHLDGRDVALWGNGSPMGARPASEFSTRQSEVAVKQFGSLGSGNHFVEVCLDEEDQVWLVLHSGSRGIGNQLAQQAVETAKGLMRQYFIELEDPNMAYLAQGTSEFETYIADMLWAQRYAFASRQQMMSQAEASLFEVVGRGEVRRTINCHHNFTAQEHHHGRDLWITRKGAIRARVGDLGVIPGSMGTRSYIVEGLGSAASYTSCSHGAGRRMSRAAARRDLTVESLREAMGDREWLEKSATQLLDEHPSAYKDIDVVMADQADLVRAVRTLRQVFNYKGA
jgi:tRNA-splicing ligase RtcB